MKHLEFFVVWFIVLTLVISGIAFASGKAPTKKSPTPKKTHQLEKDFKPIIHDNVAIDEKEQKVLAEYIYQSQVTLDRETADRIAKSILENASKYYISYEILVGIADVESKFRPWATSDKGAKGLMQIMFSVHKKLLERTMNRKLQERDLYVIETSVEGACIILQMYGIIDTPETAIGKYFGISKETNGYVAKVFYATGKYVAYRQKIRRKLFEKEITK